MTGVAIQGDVVYTVQYWQQANTVKLAKTVHTYAIRMANDPFHPLNLSSAYHYYFHSLLAGPVDAPPPNHCFKKRVPKQ